MLNWMTSASTRTIGMQIRTLSFAHRTSSSLHQTHYQYQRDTQFQHPRIGACINLGIVAFAICLIVFRWQDAPDLTDATPVICDPKPGTCYN
jgi:hypothetical protein